MPVDRESIPRPVFRNLRVFAVDPGMTARFETAVMNETTLRIPWEELEKGPSGEYVVVVDADERGTRLHLPVDLDSSEVLAEGGLPPSDGNPQFRQQMVYAVAMRTIKNFERALGRMVHWPAAQSNGAYRGQLCLYPHFMEEPNAYYVPDGGIRFGYFESGPESPFPGTIVFSCLSQDVIAHQVTHALLMGLNVEFDIGTNRDVAALHEGFADLIALFQHFSESDVLREQIGAIRGNLEERSLLGAVAPQFGKAIGQPDGLRNALGFTDAEGTWHARRPDPKLYETADEPHARGDLLVGAVSDAFRSYGIGPADVGTLSVDTLCWEAPEGSKASAVVSDFVRTLAKAESYWNIPRERERLWHTLEAWRRALEDRLKEQGRTTKKLGVIDLTKPFDVVTFDLQERAALTGDFSLQWVIKIVQRSETHTAGST